MSGRRTDVARHAASPGAHVTPAGTGPREDGSVREITVDDQGAGRSEWGRGWAMSSARERAEQVGGMLATGDGRRATGAPGPRRPGCGR